MHKVRIMKPHKAVVIINGQSIVKMCQAGEDVFIPVISKEDLKYDLYRVYKTEIITPAAVTRKRPEINKEINISGISEQIQSTVELLQKAMQQASTLITKLSEVKNDTGTVTNKDNLDSEGNNNSENKIIVNENIQPEVAEEHLISEGEKPEKIYTEQDLNLYSNRINDIINNTVIDKTHPVVNINHSTIKLPVYAEAKVGVRQIEGELNISDQVKIEGMDIFDRNPVINLITDKKGKVDVFGTLGLQVANRED